MVPKIKICGITNKEEIQMLNEAKVDYAGFVIAPSKRQISVDQAMKLKDDLDKGIQSVAVVVQPDPYLLEAVLHGGFSVLQWHGMIPKEILSYLKPMKIWQAISIKDKSSFEEMMVHPRIEGYVLDNRIPGSGRPFDWKLLEDQSFKGLRILAGGLNAENVQEAIEKVHPHIVDVSSGVEGRTCKDRNLIRTFVRKVREI